MKKMLLIMVSLLTVIIGTLAFASCGEKGDRIESDDKTAYSETGASAGQTEAKGILSADINENGELILILTDGTSVNLGVVKIDKGDKDDIDGKDDIDSKDSFVTSIIVNDRGEIVAVYNDGTTAILGTVGSVKSGEMKDGKFVLTFIDGKTITCDVVATANTVVSIKTVGNTVEIEYDDGHIDTFVLGGDVTCRHENMTYIEQVAHKMNADGSFENGVYLELCPDCGYAYTFVGVVHSFEKIVVAASSADDGYTYKKCTVCGYETNEEESVDIH